VFFWFLLEFIPMKIDAGMTSSCGIDVAVYGTVLPFHPFISPLSPRRMPKTNLQPALRRRPTHLRIDALRPADAPGKGDHARNMNPDGTIAAATEDAVFPDDSLHFFQGLPVDPSPLFIQLPERMDHLIGWHVLRILVVSHVEEAAFRTETAMNAVGQEALHLAFLPVQQLSDFSRVDRFCFLPWHPRLHQFSLTSYRFTYQVRLPWEKLYSLPIRKRYRKKKIICPNFVNGMVINITSPDRMWRKMTVL
jgi:hypothetical protein